jgi:hypothetical protein
MKLTNLFLFLIFNLIMNFKSMHLLWKFKLECEYILSLWFWFLYFTFLTFCELINLIIFMKKVRILINFESVNFDEKTEFLEKKWNFCQKWKKTDFIEKKACRKRLCFCSGWGLYTFMQNYRNLSIFWLFSGLFLGHNQVFFSPIRAPCFEKALS